MKIWSEMTEAVVKVLKLRFPNLTVEETVKLTHEIIDTCVAVAMRHGVKAPE